MYDSRKMDNAYERYIYTRDEYLTALDLGVSGRRLSFLRRHMEHTQKKWLELQKQDRMKYELRTH